MEAILPLNTIDREMFLKSARKIGCDKMSALKFIYIMQESDLHIFSLMGEERIKILLYLWQLCNDYDEEKADERNSECVRVVIRMLVPYSLNIWFSEEWKSCCQSFRTALLYCLERAKDLLKTFFKSIKWEAWLQLGLTPHNVNYLKGLSVKVNKIRETTKVNSLETIEDRANIEDLNYFGQEQLFLIVLRLIKLFDSKSIDTVKILSMRIIAAWNAWNFRDNRFTINCEDKRCLIFMCHIYLMAIYEIDDVQGYVIDNMLNNIRFYHQGLKMQISKSQQDNAMKIMEYTPARLIAMTCVNLFVEKREFFEAFIYHSFDIHLVTLFGVTSQAYKSYLLGNMLMELNLMKNEENFVANFQLYKSYMDLYVNERENSERFLLDELRKKEAHSTVQRMNLKSKICKGNRISNIASYENPDDREKSIAHDENVIPDRKLDTIFQNIPNNEKVLYYVYELLALRSYKGWHFPKIIILLKIIGHEWNAIETWRYHPGLTTNFMQNLEIKLSRHYEGLADVFIEQPFLEQEFRLTAFYLNPTKRLHAQVIRCGMRFNKRRLDEHQRVSAPTTATRSAENIPILDAKQGLNLSSIIDAKETADVTTNNETITYDYSHLFQSLHAQRLPDSMVKDILTIIFLPRNKNFAWTVNWTELRKRCKVLLKNSLEKRRFIEFNMEEANERLKFLNVDYEKYKNRPQLDYGTVEEGYENHIFLAETSGNESDPVDEDKDEEVKGKEKEEEEEDESEDFEDDEDNYTITWSKFQKKFHVFGERRTRARTSNAVANTISNNLEKSYSNMSEQKPPEPKACSSYGNHAQDRNVSSSTVIRKKGLNEWLKVRPKYINSTQGFVALPDIWNVENRELKAIDKDSTSFLKVSAVVQRFKQLKSLQEDIKREQEEDEHVNDKNGATVRKRAREFECIKEKERRQEDDEYVHNKKEDLGRNHAPATVHTLFEGIKEQEDVEADDNAEMVRGNHLEYENSLREETIFKLITQATEVPQNESSAIADISYEEEDDDLENIELGDLGNAYPADAKEDEQIVQQECEKQSVITIETGNPKNYQNEMPLIPRNGQTSKLFSEISLQGCHENDQMIAETTLEESQPVEDLEPVSCEGSLDNVREHKNESPSRQGQDEKMRPHKPEILKDMMTGRNELVSCHKRKDKQDLLKSKRVMKFKNACLKNQLKVRLRKLKANDYGDLYQPRVLLKRVNISSGVEILNNPKKRRHQ
uniref:Uncharacterized protein n=1 Tax=Glossina pallidipes TaxID=7398 RepID=A0A1B0A9J7_GLOPL